MEQGRRARRKSISKRQLAWEGKDRHFGGLERRERGGYLVERRELVRRTKREACGRPSRDEKEAPSIYTKEIRRGRKGEEKTYHGKEKGSFSERKHSDRVGGPTGSEGKNGGKGASLLKKKKESFISAADFPSIEKGGESLSTGIGYVKGEGSLTSEEKKGTSGSDQGKDGKGRPGTPARKRKCK